MLRGKKKNLVNFSLLKIEDSFFLVGGYRFCYFILSFFSKIVLFLYMKPSMQQLFQLLFGIAVFIYNTNTKQNYPHAILRHLLFL